MAMALTMSFPPKTPQDGTIDTNGDGVVDEDDLIGEDTLTGQIDNIRYLLKTRLRYDLVEALFTPLSSSEIYSFDYDFTYDSWSINHTVSFAGMASSSWVTGFRTLIVVFMAYRTVVMLMHMWQRF